MQLSREEFWILDTTTRSNFVIPLSLLNFPDTIAFNKPYHNLTTEQLVDLLEFMQKQGDLVVFRYEKELFPECKAMDAAPQRAPWVRDVVDFTPVWEYPVFYPRATIIKEFAIADEERQENPIGTRVIDALCFCATRQGAEKWEETAQVDWNKYLDDGFSLIDDADLAENQSLWIGRAATLSEQTLDAYFDWKTRWGAHPDSRETSYFRRYHTERIAPWKATYWKTFSEGFECDYLQYTVHRTRGMHKAEYERYQVFWEQSWSEHHALFDWCNRWTKDSPFADG